ncbi:MAG: aldo/keto reductase [Candidatus Yanofskybacteria bacterium]|nr:aldo/keto reductase [Candidatus Yanofskybacteria bacterium]
MKYRPLGASGIIVSEIGFGGWGIGGVTPGPTSYGPTDDNESRRALETAFDKGINYYDTASVYGKSEELIGKTFRDKRDQVVIGTKVGFLEHHTPQDFSQKNIVATLEKSLNNLGTDYIDLYQLHNPDIPNLPMDEIIDTLNGLKTRGLIRALGVSVKHPNHGLTVFKYGIFSSIQANLSMIDQRAIDNNLMELAEEQSVGVIGRTPLNFGFLTDNGKTMSLDFSPQDHRSVWPMKQREAWQKAARLLSEVAPEYPLAQLALCYCLSIAGVSTVIPGLLTVNDVLENTLASSLPRLSPDQMDQIRQIYNENDQFFVQQPRPPQ